MLVRKQSISDQRIKHPLETLYRKYVINPCFDGKDHYTDQELDKKAREIYQWAKVHGATHYTLWGFPEGQAISEKQELFLDVKYFYENNLVSKGRSRTSFTKDQLTKGEGDGSSFSSGGTRQTHAARAYLVWDPRSEIFLRTKNKVLYIPALLVAHDGTALDDKTLMRSCENVLSTQTKKILAHLGVTAKSVNLALGMQQQFFVIPKDVYKKRIDVRQTGRFLVGSLPPRNQQFSDHYYGKIPEIVENILRDCERQLLELGVPCKTRHKQVAINQFQFCPLFEEVGQAIVHNTILMEVLKEQFDANGFTALFHEKPFQHANGSGKHCNWSLNYVDQNNLLVNCFKYPKNGGQKQLKIYKIFMLLTLEALLKHSKLYLTAISNHGNELRLGGHEAPPRIISAFLGSFVSSVLDGKQQSEIKNFKGFVPGLSHDVFQQDTDRNRTSPYAFAGNKFEFRAVGSSQNCAFAMAIISGTIARQAMRFTERLDKGENVDKLIEQLTESCRKVRFEGNGYSPDWPIQAKKRGLYVNEEFWENIENFKEAGKVFTQIGVCTDKQVNAKYNKLNQRYRNVVDVQLKTLSIIIQRQAIPRFYDYLNTLGKSQSKVLSKKTEVITKAFEELVECGDQILAELERKDLSLKEVNEQRLKGLRISETVTKCMEHLPKSENFPDFEDFFDQY